MHEHVRRSTGHRADRRPGLYQVPEKPGLGIEFNEDALKYRVDGPDYPPLDMFHPDEAKRAIYAIVRDNGSKTWYNGEIRKYGFWNESHAGNVPMFEHGIRLETWANDGSKEWAKLAKRTLDGPVKE